MKATSGRQKGATIYVVYNLIHIAIIKSNGFVSFNDCAVHPVAFSCSRCFQGTFYGKACAAIIGRVGMMAAILFCAPFDVGYFNFI